MGSKIRNAFVGVVGNFGRNSPKRLSGSRAALIKIKSRIVRIAEHKVEPVGKGFHLIWILNVVKAIHALSLLYSSCFSYIRLYHPEHKQIKPQIEI